MASIPPTPLASGLEGVFVLSGVVLLAIAAASARDERNPARAGTALFWALLGVIFVTGSLLPHAITGALVLALAALEATGQVRHGSFDEPPPAEREARATKLGNGLFLPVLCVPVLTYGGLLAFSGSGYDLNHVLYISLGAASVAAALLALALTRDRPGVLVEEGRRLADAVGPVVILPQLLASLGVLFTAAGVGAVIAHHIRVLIPAGSPLMVVSATMLSVAALSFLMGNSFAAYPVIMSGLAAPLLIEKGGADPAMIGALLMTAASCGTLCSPMAANFNLVPPALFEMRDRYGVIRFQAPFALAMLAVHIAIVRAMLEAR